MSLIGDSALADYYLPLIRADLLLSSQLLSCAAGLPRPAGMFYGENDELIDRQDLLDWRRIAQRRFSAARPADICISPRGARR
ncbi:hypothetical protein M8494_20265 [Serratia ureilytica]